MRRFLQTHPRHEGTPQALVILHEGEAFLPTFVHAAIDQDRPIGDVKTFHEHTHDLYHVLLYTQSSGSYLKCGQKYEAEPGTLVIVSPGQPHDFVSLRRSSVYSEITFSFAAQSGKVLTLPFERILNLYTGIAGRLDGTPRLPRDITQELVIIMIQIMDYLQSPSSMSDYYACRALANVLDVITAHCYTEAIPGAAVGQNNPILQVRQYIDEHYAEAITADDLTSMSHCSKGHLFRTFKRSFRVSPLAYQQDLRFEAARRLLRFTSLRCYEIAQRVGFTNVYYFHRQFKKRMGVTPKQYRLSTRQLELGPE
ncbi:MAG: helix-turn-helix transcriptional regulator [Sedimentisphaerales bacterium]|nr:helix-turn-helix transcriptional regulator [Sedimentisphaerales bacterium]